MFDIRWIRENPEAFDRGLARRGLEPLSQRLISMDELRRSRIRVLESWLETRNSASREIGLAKANKDENAVRELMTKVAEAKESIANLEREVRESEILIRRELIGLPNLPADDVPSGADEKGNVERTDHAFGNKRNINSAKEHFELGEALGLMSFEKASKLSGSRFVVLSGALAHLERAISQFFLDTHTTEFGYVEVATPLLVNDDVMFGTAQLPKFRDDQFQTRVVTFETQAFEMKTGTIRSFDARERFEFHDKKVEAEFYKALNIPGATWSISHKEDSEGLILSVVQRLWLIPTAEVPLTNLVRESIVAEEELPLRYTACTPCFRAEAGAAGKDTRGMLRQHQFTKVELVSITTPEQSKAEHERMLSAAEEVLKRLGLHFRVMTLCTGDMGFASQKTYDIEVWLPGQNAYREISSCSNCGSFQAMRMHPRGKPNEGTRYRGKDGKMKGYVHTLNGSGVAVGRALIAVMENYQDENGAIAIPEVLQPYMGGLKKIEKKH